jgi:hypothetical protein
MVLEDILCTYSDCDVRNVFLEGLYDTCYPDGDMQITQDLQVWILTQTCQNNTSSY